MKIYDTWKKAFEDKDFDGLMKFYHPDYSFIRHQTNTTMSLSEWFPMMKSMLESNKFEMISWKCIYENDDILVDHNVLSFPDGSKEAVLACHMKKDGKIISTETGATPLSN